MYIKKFLNNLKLIKETKGFSKYLFIIVAINLLIILPYLISVSKLYAIEKKEAFSTRISAYAYNLKQQADMLNHDMKVAYEYLLGHDMIEDAFKESQKRRQDVRSVAELLNQAKMLDDRITDIELYDKKNQYVYSTKSSGEIDRFTDAHWYQRYQETKGYGIGSYIVENRVGKEQYIFVLMEIWQNSSESSGVMIFHINMTEYYDTVIYPMADATVECCVVDGGGNLLFTTNPDVANVNTVSDDQYKEYWSGDMDILVKKYKNHLMTKVSTQNGWFDYYVLMDIEENHLQGVLTILITLVFLVAAALGVLTYVLIKVYGGLANIIRVFSEISGEGYDGDFESDYVDYISKNVVNIISRNKNVERDLTMQLLEMRELKNMAFRMQINPHFAFNTLQSINAMIISEIEGDNDATRMIALFAQLLKMQYENNSSLIPIEREVECAAKYLEIQQMKYKDKIKAVFHVDENVLNYKCLAMMIQPLVENSIQHGMKKEISITIDICEKNENVSIEITDTGRGMTEEELAVLRNRMNNLDIPAKKHIGLANVIYRHKILFGDQCSITVDSVKEQFTKICILFPKI